VARDEQTDLVLHDGAPEVARAPSAIALLGLAVLALSRDVRAGEREAAAARLYHDSDTTCRLFGYHGLINATGRSASTICGSEQDAP